MTGEVADKQLLLFGEDNTYLVRLEGFDGPLELLLHLIRKHKYDIFDIPIAAILAEYLSVIEAMQELDIDLAGEFLVMAASLTQIKSRMLLPKPAPLGGDEGEEGEDPRSELVRRLLDYERFREAAITLGQKPLLGKDVFVRPEVRDEERNPKPEAPLEANLFSLLVAFREVLKTASEDFIHEVSRQRMTTQEAMSELMERFIGLKAGESLEFRELFAGPPRRDRIVALFMGLLELVRMRAVRIWQPVAFGEIRIMPVSGEEE
ncbi:segregation/condensation protein A [bacterium]|nr:MAG: segregation/condensation protein A [bacterium]